MTRRSLRTRPASANPDQLRTRCREPDAHRQARRTRSPLRLSPLRRKRADSQANEGGSDPADEARSVLSRCLDDRPCALSSLPRWATPARRSRRRGSCRSESPRQPTTGPDSPLRDRSRDSSIDGSSYSERNIVRPTSTAFAPSIVTRHGRNDSRNDGRGSRSPASTSPIYRPSKLIESRDDDVGTTKEPSLLRPVPQHEHDPRQPELEGIRPSGSNGEDLRPLDCGSVGETRRPTTTTLLSATRSP